MSQKFAVAVCAVVFAVAGLVVFQWRFGRVDAPDPVASGQHLFAARLAGVDGSLQSIEQWRGRVLVVNFWATWCAPCREEIPGFIKFQNSHGSRGVQFVGIAVDTPERVSIFAKDLGINYPLLVGGIETMELARELGDRSGVLPYSLVLNREGRVVASIIGVLKPERLEDAVLPLL
jgi:thiol-disulfide isomerase/thioredoxin